ncbi:MAG: hypothetical protein OEW67_15040 [Cyclobacteriaceae bacterium]|nr:hypothetical protein [Cyclobacteriaceae bacterium]
MHIHLKLLFLIIYFITPSFSIDAQQSRTNFELSQKMNRAIELIEKEDYHTANTVFRNILATEKVLPTNLSYYFSLTLYHIEQYRNSHNFLEKYLNLTGKAGDFYDQSIQLQKLLENAFTDIKNCDLCDINGYQFMTCSVCKGNKNTIEDCSKCRSAGIISCQKCKAEGVVITIDSFGEHNYQTCDRCLGKGIHTCDLCEGEKQLNLVCNVCLGTGNQSSKVICTHH